MELEALWQSGGALWRSGVIEPLSRALIFLYDLTGSWGIAIILFTLIVRAILLPLTLKSMKSQKAMQALQPELKKLQKLYGDDRQRMAQEQMELYRKHGVSPLGGCLPMLVQMPIWFGLYQALMFLGGLWGAEAAHPQFAQPFLWLPSLAKPDPLYILPVLSGATQWVAQKMMTPRAADKQQQLMNQMMQFMPLMFFFFALTFPSGLVLYWVASNVFQIGQQYFITGWGTLLPEPKEGQPAAFNLGFIGRLLGTPSIGAQVTPPAGELAKAEQSSENPGDDGARRSERRSSRGRASSGRRRKGKRK